MKFNNYISMISEFLIMAERAGFEPAIGFKGPMTR